MASADTPRERRSRGSIRRRDNVLQVRVSAGKDPATGDRIVLTETIRIERPGNEKSERAAMKQAESALNRLLVEADDVKAARSKSTVGALLDKWLPKHDVDETTRDSYESLIRRYIRPALGDVPLTLFMRNLAERLETFYADLRRCRKRCNPRRPFIEHRSDGPHECRTVRHRRRPGRPRDGGSAHDCVTAGCQVIECRPHTCEPLAKSSVRRIHMVLSAALTAADRWDWISENPARTVKKPTAPRPQPRPPSPAQMAAIVEEAWRRDDEFGLFVWLSAILGNRRGEILAVRFDNCDLDEGVVSLYENWVWSSRGLILKDTKDHQMRRISIDQITVDLIRRHKTDCSQQLFTLGLPLTGTEFLFSREPDRNRPRDPSSMTRRYGRLVRRLGIKTELRQLRHYSATELLTAGVDLRTVAGRLGHRDGITTMRHYAAWVGSADKQAAEKIAARMPAPPKHRTAG